MFRQKFAASPFCFRLFCYKGRAYANNVVSIYAIQFTRAINKKTLFIK